MEQGETNENRVRCEECKTEFAVTDEVLFAHYIHRYKSVDLVANPPKIATRTGLPMTRVYYYKCPCPNCRKETWNMLVARRLGAPKVDFRQLKPILIPVIILAAMSFMWTLIGLVLMLIRLQMQ